MRETIRKGREENRERERKKEKNRSKTGKGGIKGRKK